MTAGANRWKLGLFVVLAGAVAIAGSTWLGYARLQKRSQQFHAYFDEAVTGLVEGAPVRFRGVPIGSVQRIAVAPDKKRIQVTAALYDEDMRRLGLEPERIERGEPPPPGLRAQIVQQALTGTAFVQVDYFADDGKGPPELPFSVPPNTLRTVPSTFKSLEEGARDLLRTLPALSDEMRGLLGVLRADLTQAGVPELARSTREVLDAVRGMLQRLERAGVEAEAGAALRELRLLAAEWRSPDGPVQQLRARLDGVLAEAEAALRDARVPDTSAALREAAAGVGGAADGLTVLGDDLRAELAGLRRALRAVEQLAETLERDPGVLLRGRPATPSPLGGGRQP